MIKAKKTILVAGAWVPQILDAVGIECYIKPKKRQFFAIPARNAALQKLLFTRGSILLTVCPSLFCQSTEYTSDHFPRKKSIGLAYADDFPRAFKLEEDPQPEKNFYEYGIYQVLTKYFPQFRNVRLSSSLCRAV